MPAHHLSLHENIQLPASGPATPEAALITAEAMARIVELAGHIGWAKVAALFRDLSAYAEMGRTGVGEYEGIDLRLVVCALAGDIGELRATHAEMSGRCTRQAHHKIMNAALDRIASRNPEVAKALREIRAIHVGGEL